MAHHLYEQTKARLRNMAGTTISYKVLKINQLSKASKLDIATAIASLNTGPQAQELRGKPPGWGYEVLDTLGRIGVLRYRGVDVCLFFKRECSEVVLEDCDPVPEGELKDPQDVWTRLDLMGLSARQVNVRIKQHLGATDAMNKLSESELIAKQAIIDQQEKNIKRLEASLTAANEEAARKRAEPGKHRELGQRDVMEGLLELLGAVQEGADNPHIKEAKLFKMLDSMGKKVLEAFGAEPIAPHTGEVFDPTLHEAITINQYFSEGLIASVGAIGIKMHGVLVKPARVVVGGKKQEEL
jgi:molecular chaperone GrpE (heat shock protein)